MPVASDPEAILERIRALALALPQASERPSHGQPTFFAADRMFAQFRHDHHGDGRTVVVVKVSGEDEATHLRTQCSELYAKAAYFRANWVAMDVGSVDPDWDLVADRLAQSWEYSAPRGLLEAGGR